MLLRVFHPRAASLAHRPTARLRLATGFARQHHNDGGSRPTTLARLSQILIPQLQPAAEDLLVRHGYIRQVSAGTYHTLPLGHLVQANIERILRKHMVSVGGSEVSLASMSLPALWKKTGRDVNTELFRIKDGRGTEFLMCPTHEEEITNLVAKEVASYRKLPLRLYQITRKYRDEKRPRGGLLRGREFTMKDMYSFDLTSEDAHKTYKQIQGAYNAFFKELGVPFVVADADSGSIGGSLSHEYHYLNSAGEDTIVHCGECGYTANEEKAMSIPQADHKAAAAARVSYAVSEDRSTLVASYFPEDRTFNPLLVEAEVPDTVDKSVADSNAALDAFMSDVKSDMDMFDKRLIRLMDARVDRNTDLPDLPFRPSRSTTTTLVDVPLVTPISGEACPSCDAESLTTSRAIEVGHTFYLGTKYSGPLSATVSSPDTPKSVVEMGCYGIGVSRLLAAIAIARSDSDGLNWPASITPYTAIVVAQNPETVGTEITEGLRAAGVNAVLDDRADVQFGQALREARQLGFPYTIVAGRQFDKTGMLEVQSRDRSLADLKADPVLCTVAELPKILS